MWFQIEKTSEGWDVSITRDDTVLHFIYPTLPRALAKVKRLVLENIAKLEE